MNKYGIENFIIEEIEQVSDDSLLAEREVYWINELQTYGINGYNATKGGDGKCLFDHNEIIELYNLGYTVIQISRELNCDRCTAAKILKANGIKPTHSANKKVDQFDQAGNYIQTFPSSNAAAEWLIDHGSSAIANDPRSARSKSAGQPSPASLALVASKSWHQNAQNCVLRRAHRLARLIGQPIVSVAGQQQY